MLQNFLAQNFFHLQTIRQGDSINSRSGNGEKYNKSDPRLKHIKVIDITYYATYRK